MFHKILKNILPFIPLIALVSLLSYSVIIFGEDSGSGPNQVALLLASLVALAIALIDGADWKTLEDQIISNIGIAMQAILVLLLVGALIGSWVASGVVPAMIYWGIDLLSPNWFYLSAILISAIVSSVTGSSWSTAGTIGLALIAISEGLQLNSAITAGAIVSGAYFGDKVSPLSETTNLAPAVAGVNLFDHIKFLFRTTLPSFALAICFFAWQSQSLSREIDLASISAMQVGILEEFSIGIFQFFPPLLVLILIIRRIPVIPSFFCGWFAGLILFTAQYNGSENWLTSWLSLSAKGYESTNSNETLKALFNKGGMENMLTTIWLILMGMMFGGIMQGAGFFHRIINPIDKKIQSLTGKVALTSTTAVTVNLSAADQYLGILITGKIFKNSFKDNPLYLSRTLEDSATMTSALIPWNTCGAFMAATLAVNTLDYAPYAVLNWISPIISLILVRLGR